jgi:hypothetical protein
LRFRFLSRCRFQNIFSPPFHLRYAFIYSLFRIADTPSASRIRRHASRAEARITEPRGYALRFSHFH